MHILHTSLPNSSYEEELTEARATVQESLKREEAWQVARATLQGDLESTEARLDEAFATCEREKGARWVTEAVSGGRPLRSCRGIVVLIVRVCFALEIAYNKSLCCDTSNNDVCRDLSVTSTL